jgi:aspartyl protease family protein
MVKSPAAGRFYASAFTESLQATPTVAAPPEIASGLAVQGDAMLKTAILFFVCSVAVAAFAPQWLSFSLEPKVGTAAAVVAPASLPAQRVAVDEVAGSREAVLHSNAHGQYDVEVLINGQVVPMIVDTGASFVSLSWRTAERLGVYPDPSGRRYRMSTANGQVIASAATVPEISFQGIYMKDVEAIISPPEVVTPDLLGTSFIKRLMSVEQRNGLLILRQ